MFMCMLQASLQTLWLDLIATLSLYIQTKIKLKLEIISTLLHRIRIPPPTVAPWRVTLYKDRQSNRRVVVFYLGSRNSWWTEVHHFFTEW